MGALAPAIIEGGAALGGAVIGGKGASRAAAAQERSTDKALSYQRETDKARRTEYDRAMAAYEQRVRYQDALRSALLGRLGFDVSGIGAPTPTYSTPSLPGRVPMGIRAGEVPPGSSPGLPQPAGGPMPAGSTIRDMIVRPGPRELSAWNDWGAHGLRAV